MGSCCSKDEKADARKEAEGRARRKELNPTLNPVQVPNPGPAPDPVEKQRLETKEELREIEARPYSRAESSPLTDDVAEQTAEREQGRQRESEYRTMEREETVIDESDALQEQIEEPSQKVEEEFDVQEDDESVTPQGFMTEQRADQKAPPLEEANSEPVRDDNRKEVPISTMNEVGGPSPGESKSTRQTTVDIQIQDMGLVDGDNHLSLAELKKQTVHFDVGDQLKLGELRTMGGYSNVHDGEIVREDGTLKVAVKCFREPGAGKDIEKAILRELFIWSRTQHENILPLIGFATPTGYKQPVLISQWMENGTVTDYMENRPVAELKDVVEGIVNGLAYLHNEGVIHADIKPGNILVSNVGKPLIADFGISRLHSGPNSITICGTSTLHGSERYFAIELLLPEEVMKQLQELQGQKTGVEIIRPHAVHTKKSDVWSFAMVVYQLIAKAIPYYDIPSNVALYVSLFQNRELRPRKPEAMQPGDMSRLWNICEMCWQTDPNKRPSMEKVREALASGSSD